MDQDNFVIRTFCRKFSLNTYRIQLAEIIQETFFFKTIDGFIVATNFFISSGQAGAEQFFERISERFDRVVGESLFAREYFLRRKWGNFRRPTKWIR